MPNVQIKNLVAREVLDSRGNPTVAVRVGLSDGTSAEAMVPSGASTGSHEATEMRDGNADRYGGNGVLQACRNVNEKILPAVAGLAADDVRAVDERMIELDGTPQKKQLGANAILGVSLAVARATATAQHLPLYKFLRQTFNIRGAGVSDRYRLPLPQMNILNGGVHANNSLTIQEFMIVPQQASFAERVRCGAEIFYALKKYLVSAGQNIGVGDEGGFAPALVRNEEACVALAAATAEAGYKLGSDVKLALDVAATEFFEQGKYKFDEAEVVAEKLIGIYDEWIEKFCLTSIEDGLAEDDWENWKKLTAQLGGRVALVGDDLFVTNTARLQQGITERVGNAILIKVNQIGTLSETIDTINLARQHNYKVIMSHRSGETEDTTIADLAVAVNADHIKTGSLCRSERVAKYNRLLAIENEI